MQVSVFSIRIDPAFLEQDQQTLNTFLETVIFKKSSTQFLKATRRIGLLLFIMKLSNSRNLYD